jgi:hypothetical protein
VHNKSAGPDRHEARETCRHPVLWCSGLERERIVLVTGRAPDEFTNSRLVQGRSEMDGNRPPARSFLEGGRNGFIKSFGHEVRNAPGGGLAGCYSGDRAWLQFLNVPTDHRGIYTGADVVHNRLYSAPSCLACRLGLVMFCRVSGVMRTILASKTPDGCNSRGTIIRSARTICLLGMGVVISGCSSGYYVDPVDYLGKQPTTRERVVLADRAPSRTARQTEAQPVATAPSGNSATIGTSVRGDTMRPWPKRGTPELEQLQAEEAERNRKIKELLRTGVCRGC